MGYSVEAKLIYGIPADEVPFGWYEQHGCEDSEDVWLEYGGKRFVAHTQGWDGDCVNYLGYAVASIGLSRSYEIEQAGEITRAIAMLDKTPFNEMSAYAVVRPRLFWICSYL